jgi:hypothetical protein
LNRRERRGRRGQKERAEGEGRRRGQKERENDENEHGGTEDGEVHGGEEERGAGATADWNVGPTNNQSSNRSGDNQADSSGIALPASPSILFLTSLRLCVLCGSMLLIFRFGGGDALDAAACLEDRLGAALPLRFGAGGGWWAG